MEPTGSHRTYQRSWNLPEVVEPTRNHRTYWKSWNLPEVVVPTGSHRTYRKSWNLPEVIEPIGSRATYWKLWYLPEVIEPTGSRGTYQEVIEPTRGRGTYQRSWNLSAVIETYLTYRKSFIVIVGSFLVQNVNRYAYRGGYGARVVGTCRHCYVCLLNQKVITTFTTRVHEEVKTIEFNEKS